jgi:L-ascorbate metabolism protein UlaG (beta-lactamase superfamily)
VSKDLASGRRRAQLTLVGGPTALIEYGPLRLLTDPTFDGPGDYPRPGTSVVLRKLVGPAIPPAEIMPVDVVAISHDHHSDNLDEGGRALLDEVPLVLTTDAGAERLGGVAVGMRPGDGVDLEGGARIVAVAAHHGPPDGWEKNGPVIGFVLSGPDLPRIYVSGDNASPRLVEEIVRDRGPFDVAVLFVGGAQVPEAWGPGVNLTLDAALATEAARALGDAPIVPIHQDGWAHFSSSPADLEAAFAAAGLADRLRPVHPGETVSLIG